MTEQFALFEDLATANVAEPKVGRITNRIWTENKARLIERYLFFFVLVTKHGTYIDGFAGPQDPQQEDKWSARLVVESRPRWLRHFFLFEKEAAQVQRINAMLAAQPAREKKEPKRNVVIRSGDCNAVQDVFSEGRTLLFSADRLARPGARCHERPRATRAVVWTIRLAHAQEYEQPRPRGGGN